MTLTERITALASAIGASIKTLAARVTALETHKRVTAFTTPPAALSATVNTEQIFNAAYAVPANSLKVGDVLVIRAMLLNTTIATPPTILFRVRIGGSIILASTAVTQTASQANRVVKLEAYLTVTAIGANGAFEAQGIAKHLGASVQMTPMTPPGAVSINTNNANNVQISVQYSAASGAGHNIQLRQLILEV